MQKKRKSLKVLNKVYFMLGKTTVFAGSFCGLFYLIGFLFNSLEPIVTKVMKFCLENLQLIFIIEFVCAFLIWFTYRVLEEVYQKRRIDDMTN